MTVRKENEPTDNQINYARSLDIYIPFGITFNELSDLISNVENNDKLATERHKAFADFYGIQYTKNVGKKSLFNKIQSEIFSNAQKDHMASWFIFRVYRSLVRGQEDVSILSPDNDTIREITGTLLENPKFFNSLKRYSDSDLRYFGEFTDHQGFTHYGASKTTNAYMLASDELKKYPHVQEDIERGWNTSTNRNNYIKPVYKEKNFESNPDTTYTKLTPEPPPTPQKSLSQKLEAKLEKMNEEADRKYRERKARSTNKSKLIAYLLLIFLGFLGGHRFYLARIKSANTIGIIFILSLVFETLRPLIFIPIAFVLIDLFLLPKMIRTPEKEWF